MIPWLLILWGWATILVRAEVVQSGFLYSVLRAVALFDLPTETLSPAVEHFAPWVALIVAHALLQLPRKTWLRIQR